jgi:hypothetical protein
MIEWDARLLYLEFLDITHLVVTVHLNQVH